MRKITLTVSLFVFKCKFGIVLYCINSTSNSNNTRPVNVMAQKLIK